MTMHRRRENSGTTLLRFLTVTAMLVVSLLFASSAHAAALKLAFVSADNDIWTIAVDGTGARHLTHGTAYDGSPAWSPGGKTIAFARHPASGGPYTIRLVPSGGGAARVLFRDAIPHAKYYNGTGGLAYAPGGGKLAWTDAYATTSGGNARCRVVVLDLKTGKIKVLLERKNGFGNTLQSAWRLSWSPDGRTLLVAQSGMDDEGGQTWLLDVASRSLSKLDVADATNADWSPDGRSMLVSTSTQTSSSILLVKPDGAVIRTLATGGGWGGEPGVGDACFSGDGQTIAYATLGAIWLMTPDGTGNRRLTTGDSPSWP